VVGFVVQMRTGLFAIGTTIPFQQIVLQIGFAKEVNNMAIRISLCSMRLVPIIVCSARIGITEPKRQKTEPVILLGLPILLQAVFATLVVIPHPLPFTVWKWRGRF